MKILLAIICFGITFSAVCQLGNQRSQVFAIIDRYVDSVLLLKQQLKDRSNKMKYLLQRRTEDARLLKKAVIEVEFANKKLASMEDSLQVARLDIKKYVSDNEVLQKQLEAKEAIIQSLKREMSAIQTDNKKAVRKSGMKELVNEAIAEADDLYYGLSSQNTLSSSQQKSRFPDNTNNLLNFKTGGKFIFDQSPWVGESFQLDWGYVFTNSRNVYLGIGVGYERFRTDLDFSVIPIYLSSKVALNDNFVATTIMKNKDKYYYLNDSPVLYLQFNAGGYIRSGVEKSVTPIARSPFASLGLGIMRNLGLSNLNISPEVAVRVQDGLATLDLKFGVHLLLW